MGRIRFIGAIAGLAALGLAAGPARAASLDAAGTTIVAFSDTHQTPYSGHVPTELALMKQLYCAGKGDQGRALSLSAALGVATRLVAADSHGRGLSAFTHGPEGRSERRAIAAGAGALAAGKPAAALAALLRAHQLAPKDPVPLIDAAPLLSQAGDGRAALALLDAAKHLKAPKTNPFGISWAAVSKANQGQALIVTHQYGAAEAALGSALKMAPLLREARQNMAVAFDCQGNQDKAKQYFFAAVRRQEFAHGDYVDQTPGDPFGQLNEAEVLDTSKGQTLTLPTLDYPQTMDEGKRQANSYVSLEEDIVQNQEPPAQKQLQADETALSQQLQKANPLTAQRTRDIQAAIQSTLSEPDLAALVTQAASIQDQIRQLQLEGYNQGGCANAGLHGTWLATVERYAIVERKLAAANYRRETAFAANLKNPLAHQVGLDIARNDVSQEWFELVDAGNLLAGYDRICDPNVNGSDPVSDSGQQETPPSPPCPSGLIGPDISVNLLVLSFSVNCEEVTVEGEIGEGWLNGFVSGTHNFKKGTNTIYAGAQVGAKGGVGPLSGGVQARGGIYVTVDSSGAFQDGGLRGTTSASVSVGSVSASVSGPEASWSVVGAFSTPG